MIEKLKPWWEIFLANLYPVRLLAIVALCSIAIKSLCLFSAYFQNLWGNLKTIESSGFLLAQVPVWPFVLTLIVFSCIYGIVRTAQDD